MKINVQKVEVFLLIVAIIVFTYLLFQKLNNSRNESFQSKINVEEVIDTIKTQLENLEHKRIVNDEVALFKVKSFDLEINFIVRNSSSSNSTLQSEVVTVGNATEVSKELVQKITLHLEAKGSDSASVSGETHFK